MKRSTHSSRLQPTNAAYRATFGQIVLHFCRWIGFAILLATLTIGSGDTVLAESVSDGVGSKKISRSATTRAPSSDSTTNSGTGWGNTVWSLTAVVGILGCVAWYARKLGVGVPASGNASLLQVVARLPLDSRNSLVVVRLGQRLLVLATSSAGVSPVTELNSEEEITEFLSRVESSRNESLAIPFAGLWSRKPTTQEVA